MTDLRYAGASDAARPAGAWWRPVALCALVALIEGFDLQAAGVAGPRLAPALGLDPARMGVFFSAATIGLILGALVGGRLVDRIGRKPVLVVAVALFGLFSFLTAFAGNFPMLLAMRFLTGVALGGALPNLVAIAAEASPAGRSSTGVAIMFAGLPAGGALAALCSIIGFGGWATVFVVGGIAPIVAVPLLVRFLHPAVLPGRTDAAANRARAIAALFGAGRLPVTLMLWAGFFLCLVVLYLLLNWLPTLLASRGIAHGQAGIVQIAFNLAGVAGSLATGRAMEAFAPRAVILVVFIGLVAALLFLATVGASFGAMLAGGAIAGASLMASQALLYGIAPTLYPPDIRGTGVGAAVAVGRIGSVVGPLLAGVMVAGGRSGTQIVIGILPIAIAGGAVLFALVGRLPAAGSRAGRKS